MEKKKVRKECINDLSETAAQVSGQKGSKRVSEKEIDHKKMDVEVE